MRRYVTATALCSTHTHTHTHTHILHAFKIPFNATLQLAAVLTVFIKMPYRTSDQTQWTAQIMVLATVT
jgi:hypothetical protein